MKNKTDIAIIVPKNHELMGIAWVFGVNIYQLPQGQLDNHGHEISYYEYECKCGENIVSSILFYMNDQTNPVSEDITKRILSIFKPKAIFLIGTSAGPDNRTKLGNVIVSSSVLVDMTEWSIKETSTPRPKQIPIKNTLVVTDASLYVEDLKRHPERIEDFMRALKEFYQKSVFPKDFLNFNAQPPRMKTVASGNDLHGNKEVIAKVWGIDDRICCYDMESSGFINACNEFNTPCLVIRGISDYGYDSEDENRTPAAILAAVFLKQFIENGLTQYPYKKPSVLQEKPIQNNNTYARYLPPKQNMYTVSSNPQNYVKFYSQDVMELAPRFVKDQKLVKALWGAHKYYPGLKDYFKNQLEPIKQWNEKQNSERSKRKIMRLIGMRSQKKGDIIQHIKETAEYIRHEDYEIYFTSLLNQVLSGYRDLNTDLL